MSNKKYVCLIQPHTSYKLATTQPALFDTFDSIGLLALAAYLDKYGYEVEVLHLAKAYRNGYSRKQIENKLLSHKPVLFAITNMWLHLSVGTIETAQLLRELYGEIPIVVGGQHASFFAKDIVKGYCPLIDGVIVGEGEETLYEIVKSVEDNGFIDKSIPGFMSYTEEDGISYTPRRITIKMDDLPFASHKYVWPVIQPIKGDIIPYVAALDTVRGGCPNGCGHCLEANYIGQLGRGVRDFHSPEWLIEQLKHYLRDGKRTIVIQDSFYANGDEPISKFVDLALKENIQTEAIHFFIEPGYTSSNIFKVLEQFPAKKVAIDYGIETGSIKVAKNMNRFHDFNRIYRDVEVLGATNTLSTAWWLIGLPGETEEDVKMTEAAIKETTRMGVFTERVSQMLLFPQSKIYQEREKYEIEAFFHNYDDFKIFSLIERRENGLYPELVTHEMPYQTKEDTIRMLRKLKKSVRSFTEQSPYYKRMMKMGFELNDFDFF